MPLRVLDGNQTATTLSSVVTGGEHIVAHTVVSLGATAISNITSAVSGSVVSISNFPSTQTVAGTVTANVTTKSWYNAANNNFTDTQFIAVGGWDNANAQIAPIPLNEGADRVLVDASNNPIFGTVTANLSVNTSQGQFIAEDGGTSLQAGVGVCYRKDITDSGGPYLVSESLPLPVRVWSGTVTIGSLPAISGTVTANNPSGALTTRFGSVTTANTAQITSAVTNTSRKYLLAQNISAGTVTIGIGFSPTTTQGIQLTAGGGLTFDAFCPTGAVYWLGAVTGAAWTILEG